MGFTFSKYLENAPNLKKINYWNLPKSTCLEIDPIPKGIKLRGKSLTVKKLISTYGENTIINKNISSILFYRGKRKLIIGLPFSLDNISFVRLYSLMASEGSNNTEFRLHVPEHFFHKIFTNELNKLFGEKIKDYIIQKEEKGFLRSTAPAIIRYLIPITNHIPRIILKDKEYCKEYLRIAFEAEGSPIHVDSKRYISIKRNVNITNIVKNNLNYPEEKRVYQRKLKKDFPRLFKKICSNPPKLLLGEHLILKEYFDINSVMNLESIRINKTDSNFGKITARWALLIYADSVNKFINKIDFISERKKKISLGMAKIKGNRRQYFSLDIMKKISKKKIIKTSDFVKEMKKIGYISPQKFLWDYYKNKKIIKRIGRGEYKLLIN